MAFLYTNAEISERENKKTISFTIATTTKIRYLGISITKEVKIYVLRKLQATEEIEK